MSQTVSPGTTAIPGTKRVVPVTAEKIFHKQKAQCLSAVDLSRKGGIDEPIAELITYINGLPQYFTTSSCSGRVCLFEEDPNSEIKKKGCIWLYTTHGLAQVDPLREALKKSVGCACFKFEPFVLHVQCIDLTAAQKFHEVAVSAGFRNSGLSVSKKGKVVSAVRSTHCLDVPLTDQGKMLVSEEYLAHIVKLANNKMVENLSRIKRYFSALQYMISSEEQDSQCKSANEKNYTKEKQHMPIGPKTKEVSTIKSAKDYDDFSNSIDLFTDDP